MSGNRDKKKIINIQKTYTTANWTNKWRNEEMTKIKWVLNGNKVSKEYIELTGTKEQRMKQMLTIYSLWNYYDHIIELWNKYRIDPALIICIWRSDSSLWRELKTANNVGNVWNTDSWKTRSYKTMEKWLEAIYQVLHNQYLGNLNYLWQLSCWGRLLWWYDRCWNKWIFVYATSNFNRGMNVRNCLGMLYSKPINELFKFRF